MVRQAFQHQLTRAETTKEALSQPDVFRLLISLPAFHSAFDSNVDEEEDEARASVAEWLWTIIEAVTIQCEFRGSDLADLSSYQLF